MFDAYLRDRVTIRRAGGLDAYNQLLPATDETDVPALFTSQTKIVRDVNGEQVISSGNVLLKTAVSYSDLIVYGGRTYAIVAIEEKRVFTQRVGFKVYLT